MVLSQAQLKLWALSLTILDSCHSTHQQPGAEYSRGGGGLAVLLGGHSPTTYSGTGEMECVSASWTSVQKAGSWWLRYRTLHLSLSTFSLPYSLSPAQDHQITPTP